MRTYFYIAVAACVSGFMAFALSFVPNLGVYALISSILLGLISLAFSTRQKNKQDFKGLFYVKACAYVLIAAAGAVFIGGLIYSAV